MFARLRNKFRPEHELPIRSLDDQQVRFIDGREVYPREGETIEHWHERKWAELPTYIQRRAVNHLRDFVLTAPDFHELRKLWHEHGVEWPYEEMFHFGGGMWVRNHLRDVVKDDELPTGNWDDFYIPCIERAIGVRE